METAERLRQERAFHDRQASARATILRHSPRLLLVSEKDYLDHESWIRPALALFGDLSNKRVLDFGCGHGMAAVVLANRGARVTAFDLSGGYLDEAHERARANGVAVDFVQADGANLPFADESFDCVWGNAVLHHLDLKRAAQDLRRVLKPGGLAVFCEPWGGNALLNWARRHVAYPGKERTPDELPLTARSLEILRGSFPGLDVGGHQLMSMVSRGLGPGKMTRILASWDQRLLTSLPFLQRWCRYVVIALRK